MQASTLLYGLGKEAESILNSTNVTNEELEDYDTVIGKLDSFFEVRRNVIFKRARFNRRNQLEGETVEQFIMELYKHMDSCE